MQQAEALEREARERRDRVLLREAAGLFAVELDASELFERMTMLIASAVDASVVFIALAHSDRLPTIEYLYDHGEFRPGVHIAVQERARSTEVVRNGKTIWGNRRDEWLHEPGAPINPDRPWTDDTVSAIFVPMFASGKTLGCLSVQSTREGAYDSDEVDLVAAIGHYLAVALTNQRLYRALERVADTDPLTGLATHSKILREIDAAIASSTSGQPLTLVLFNVVNFAMFNATHGYAQGDAILRDVAATIDEIVKADGMVGRFGGDIFALLLRGKIRVQVERVVERVARALRDMSFTTRYGSVPIAVACGYALAPFDAAMRIDLVALATHRTRLSRKRGTQPVGEDDLDSYTLHGSFTGLESIVESLIESDPFLRAHLFHVNTMAKHWAEFNLDLSADELGTFLQASLLHDVGKLLISDRILVKPDRLTNGEYRAVQEHAAFGRTIVSHQPGYESVAEIIAQHHERWDGAGYPAALASHAIHPLARAISILDAFSAMTMDRPYHRGISEAQALAEIERCAGSQFDPGYAQRFLAWRNRSVG